MEKRVFRVPFFLATAFVSCITITNLNLLDPSLQHYKTWEEAYSLPLPLQELHNAQYVDGDRHA